jgi:hypothetical protein
VIDIWAVEGESRGLDRLDGGAGSEIAVGVALQVVPAN